MSLDRTQVVVAAVDLLREKGFAALSMRALAQRLGVTTMATYNHVRDRQALIDAVAEHHWASVDVSPDLVRTARALHRAYREQPWLVPVYRSTTSATVAADMEQRMSLDGRRLTDWLGLAALAAGLAEYEAAGHAPGTDWEARFAEFAERLAGG